MRAITAAERAAIAGLHLATYGKLELMDSDGTWRDTSSILGKDWFTTARLSEGIDSNSMSLTATLQRANGLLSLAPLLTGSLVNRNAGGSYAPLADLWRRWRLSLATMRAGYPPTGADWKEIGAGRVDTIDTAGEQIQITGRDEGAVILDKWIDTPRQYGSVGGIAMETVIQSMLDDNLGAGVVTLYTPVSPGYLMNPWTQPIGNLMAALTAVAEKAGHSLRYRYDSGNSLRFTLFKADRTASTELWSLGPSEYTAVPLNKIDDSGVRNFIKLRFAHATLGTQTVMSPWVAGSGTLTVVAGAGTFSVSQAGVIANGSVVIAGGIAYSISGFNGSTLCTVSSQSQAGGVPTFGASAFTASGTSSSLTQFGRRDMEIDLAYTSQVNDPTKAQAMCDAIRSDTELPALEQQFETLGAWFIQLHDYGKFLANGVHYDTDQLGGVTSLTHTMANGTVTTAIGARGKPSGRYATWRLLAAQTVPGGVPLNFAQAIAQITATTATQVTVTVTANPASPPQQVQLVGITGSATLSSGTAAGTWVTPNGSNNVWVFNRGALNAGVGQVQFRAGNTNSFQNDDDLVTIEEQGRDTVYLAMRARVISNTASTVVVRVAVADPYPQGAASVSIAWQDLGSGGVTPTSPQTVTPASTITEAAGTFVDFTITRPAFGTGAGRVTFTATASNRTSDSDAVDIPPTDRDTQSLSVRVLRVSESATQVVARVEVISPNAGATVTVAYDNGGLTVSPSSGGTLTSTSVFSTTAHIDYTITRDVYGGTPRRVAFTASASGFIDATDGVDVAPINALTLTLSVGTCYASNAGSTGPPYNQLEVAFSSSGMPSGTTYDVTFNNAVSGGVGSTSGLSASPATFTSVTFAGTPGKGTCTVFAKAGGVTLATALSTGVYAT